LYEVLRHWLAAARPHECAANVRWQGMPALCRDGQLQRARVPRRLRHRKLGQVGRWQVLGARLLPLHRVVRRRHAAPLPQPRRAHERRRGVPAHRRDSALQQRPVPRALHRVCVRRVEHVHKVVRHRLAEPRAHCAEARQARRLPVSVPAGDPRLQHPEVRCRVRCWGLAGMVHVHGFLRFWRAAPLSHARAAHVWWRGMPAQGRFTLLQRTSLPGGLRSGLVEVAYHVHHLMWRWLAAAKPLQRGGHVRWQGVPALRGDACLQHTRVPS